MPPSMGRISKNAGIVVEGIDDVIRELHLLAAGEGEGSIKPLMRKMTKDAMTNIVLPKAKAALAVHSPSNLPQSSSKKYGGKPLASQLKVRARKAGGKSFRVGHVVGFPDPLFKGDTFYAGFLEFGTDERQTKKPVGRWGVKRGKIKAVRFLRNALWSSETQLHERAVSSIKELLAEANRKT